MPPVEYPSTLPVAGLSGAAGGPIQTTISDERELGTPEIRQRQGMVNQVINVEYPPINQTTYDAFVDWFNNDLYGGVLPFMFNDAITKTDHVYKFVKNTPAYTVTRMTDLWLTISFQLIRLKTISVEVEEE